MTVIFFATSSVRVIPNLVRNLLLYSRSLQRILKQVQDDNLWTVGWRTFGPTLRTDAFRIQQTRHHTCLHTPETLDCRRMTSITWSGGEATTQNSPIFFPWEIKTKNNFQSSPKPKTPILRLHKTNVARFFLNVSLGFIWSGEFRNQIP